MTQLAYCGWPRWLWCTPPPQVLLLHRLVAPCRPGRYALQSLPFLRWWFATRLTGYTSPIYVNHYRSGQAPLRAGRTAVIGEGALTA